MRSIQIFTPVLATIAAVGLFAGATMGETSVDRVAQKSDRFALAADLLCEGQAWPKLSSECLAWRSGEAVEGQVRYVTKITHVSDASSTILSRSTEIIGN